VPAAARGAREARLAGIADVTIAAPRFAPSPRIIAECKRLSSEPALRFADSKSLRPESGTLLISGDRIVAASELRQAQGEGVAVAAGNPARDHAAIAALTAGDSRRRLAAARRGVLLKTAKPTDGVVSHHLNRRISRAISGMLLAVPGVRPIHATAGTAILAALMFAALLEGTDRGLLAGALLFQAASVFDGVDGEIARATFRCSRLGAALDSLIDAATNLAFLLGVALNLHWQGSHLSAQAGFSGLAMLVVGLTLIGRASAKSHAPFSFDVVKEYYRARSGAASTRMVRGLTALTSRDFFALGFALLIASGMASQALSLFALIAAGWLAAVIFALAPRQA
jgi:CDP-L-myo-inositol myo-inositolphosphotransferase